MKNPVFIFSCEHASNQIPAAHRELFSGKERWLQSHRGWDPGALFVARQFSKKFEVPLFEGKHSRLLVDLNRTEDHLEVFSPLTAKLSAAEKEKLLSKHHRPHWTLVRNAVEKEINKGRTVIHIGFHSFTPIRKGQVRTTDIGFLFDPERAKEFSFCDDWQKSLVQQGDYRVKKNYPYKGTGNGLTNSLRNKFGRNQYLGIELEMNQKLLKKENSLDHMARVLLQTCPTI